MKFIELLAIERKPISPFSLEDVLTNYKYAQKAWSIWKTTDTFINIKTAKSYYENNNIFMDSFNRKAFFSITSKGEFGEGSSELLDRKDNIKSHLRIKHSLFADMIDQIAGFILNNKFSITTDKDEIKDIRDELENKFDFSHLLKLQTKEHLIKGYAGTNFRFDEDGEIKLEPIAGEGFGFFYLTTTNQEVEFTIINSSIENKFIEKIGDKEKWTTSKTEKYTIISKDGIVEHSKNFITKDWQTTDLSLYSERIQKTGTEVKVLEKNKIETPLIPFSILATQTLRSELHKIQEIIDALDINTSDSITELINLVKNLWVLKGNDGSTISETLNLIDAGVVNIDEESEISNLQGFEATEKRIKMNDHLKETFYRLSKTVDLEKLKSLSNTSSVSIKALYESLNQKAKDIETAIGNYIIDILKKVYMLKNQNLSKKQIEEFFYNTTIDFKHDMISNENEDLTANSLQVGNVPEKIRLQNHPWLQGKTESDIDKIIKEQNETNDKQDDSDEQQKSIPKNNIKNV